MDKKRVTIKLKNPNPLFTQWLTEWRDEEKSKNSKKQHCYMNALQSLKKYPLPLLTGKDCIILQGFGEKLCQMLDTKLKSFTQNVSDDVAKTQKVKPIPKTHRNYISSTPSVLTTSNDIDNFQNEKLPHYNYTSTSISNDTANLHKDMSIPKTDCIYISTSTHNVLNISNDITKPHKENPIQKTSTSTQDELTITNKTQKAKPKQKTTDSSYTPSYRSGGYAILIVLYQDSINSKSKGYMNKNEIIEKGIHFCDKSFTKTDAGSYYNAWSTMSTLITKSLVQKESNPAKFSLTDQGLVVAHKLYKNHMSENNTNSDSLPECRLSVENVNQFNIDEVGKGSQVGGLLANQVMQSEVQVAAKGRKKKIDKFPSVSSISSETSSAVEESFLFSPNTFDVILLVDTQETAGAGKKAIEDETILELNHLQVNYEVRHLKVGDYAWICRERDTKKELVLPYVVERKRMDDFGASIKDGRFHEQKFRLKQSGITNLIYVVESYGSNKYTGLPLSTLYQAATNTLIQDEFSVKFTDNLRGTMEYLASFSAIMINVFKSKTLMSCAKTNLTSTGLEEDLIPLMTFKEFNQSSSKNKTLKVRDLFIKQLLQLKGVSVDKALGVVEVYPTPRTLKTKYGECATKQGENLLANVEFGKLRKKIGPTISKTIFQFFTARTY